MSWEKYTRSINGQDRTAWRFVSASNGQDGKHVSSANVDENNSLSLTLSDGQNISAGVISTGWTISGDNTYCNVTGNVGIGINNPTSKLDVGGELVADKLSWGSALGMWGVPHFEVAEFNDAFWKADVRYSPNVAHSLSLDSSWTVTPLDASDAPHGTYSEVTRTLEDLSRLFDGDFDTYVEFEGSDPDIGDAEYTGGFNTKHVITIDNTGTTYSGAGHDAGFIYPQGAVYLTFYHISKNYDGTPTLEYQVQGSSTWVAIGAPTDVARKSINSDYVTLKWEIPASPNRQTKLRLTILAKPRTIAIADRSGSSWWADRIGISSLNYYMDRFYTSDLEPPYVSKYTKRNTILSQIVLEDGSTDDPTLGFRSTLDNHSSIGNFHKGKVQAGICYNSANNAMVLTGGGAAALAITNSQNIGIGTLDPSSLLHVSGDEPGLAVQRTDNAKDSSIQFLGSANFIGAYLKHIGDEASAGGTNNDLAIGTGSTVAERMRIRGDGKVGIGTASPGKLLEVAGDLKVDGTTTINNVEYTWPADDGSDSQVLSTDGAGNVSWATASGGSLTFSTTNEFVFDHSKLSGATGSLEMNDANAKDSGGNYYTYTDPDTGLTVTGAAISIPSGARIVGIRWRIIDDFHNSSSGSSSMPKAVIDFGDGALFYPEGFYSSHRVNFTSGSIQNLTRYRIEHQADLEVKNGVKYKIIAQSDPVVDFTAVGAADNNIGTAFTASGDLSSLPFGAKVNFNFSEYGAADNNIGTIFIANDDTFELGGARVVEVKGSVSNFSSYIIAVTGSPATDFTAVGSPNNNVGTVFTATGDIGSLINDAGVIEASMGNGDISHSNALSVMGGMGVNAKAYGKNPMYVPIVVGSITPKIIWNGWSSPDINKGTIGIKFEYIT